MPNVPKPDIQSPHDGFTRELLSRLDIATDFLHHYLPPEIMDGLDLSAVEKRKDTFVDEELRRHFSDLVFKVGLKTGGDARVIILVDHKSGADKWAALQLLRYEVQIWQEEKNDKAGTLPVIIPVVLYHGRKRWPANREFSSLFSPAELKLAREFVPHFKYYVCDLSRFSDEELKGGIELRAGLMLLKHIFSRNLKEPLIRVFRLVAGLPDWRRNEYLGTIRRYLTSAKAPLSREDMAEVLEESFQEEAGGIMEYIGQSWIEEGEKRGLQQGLQQGLALAILTPLEWRFGPVGEPDEKRVHALPPEKLKALSIAALSFKTPKDLTDWLKNEAV